MLPRPFAWLDFAHHHSLEHPLLPRQTRPGTKNAGHGGVSDFARPHAFFVGQCGGQNPAEAVAAGKPTIVGPRMDNFLPLVQGLVAGSDPISIPMNQIINMTVVATPRSIG